MTHRRIAFKTFLVALGFCLKSSAQISQSTQIDQSQLPGIKPRALMRMHGMILCPTLIYSKDD